jgi:hypothetical protein
VKLCVAVDQSGFALTSTNPAGAKWGRPFRIDSNGNAPLTGVSCPTVKLCVAIDASGNVITSTKPTRGSRAWKRPLHVDPTASPGGDPAGLTGISCPSTSVCVAVDGATPGNIVSTLDPTGGASKWKLTAVGGLLTSVSCPTTALCVAAGSQHYLWTATTGASKWRATGTQPGGGAFSDIFCPSASLCLASGYGNASTALLTSSTRPTGGAGAWHTLSLGPNPPSPGTGLLDSVGCMLAGTLCIATDSSDNAFTASLPGTAPSQHSTGTTSTPAASTPTSSATGTWSAPTDIAKVSSATASWSSIGCAQTLCVVVDSNGYAMTGTPRH